MMNEVDIPNDDERRAAFLGSLESAVEDGDEDFATELLQGQDVLKPVEVIEYLSVKAKNVEDPVAQRRWRDTCLEYSNSLAGRKMPQEDIDSINAAMKDLEFHEVANNKETASSEYDEVIEGDLALPEDRLARLQENIVFQEAWKLAGTRDSYGDLKFASAIDLIERQAPPRLAEDMRFALDTAIFHEAGELMKKRDSYGDLKIDHARALVDQHASNPERRDLILRKLGLL